MSAANSFINIGAAVVMHDLPIAFGKRLRNELIWGRAVTVLIAVAAAFIAQNSGTMVAFLGIFGWGLFASTLRAGARGGTQLGWRDTRGRNRLDRDRTDRHCSRSRQPAYFRAFSHFRRE